MSTEGAPGGGGSGGAAAAWLVEVSAPKVSLDGSGRGQLSFTVTNTGAVADRAVFDVVPDGGADKGWFSIDDRQRSIPPGERAEYMVQVAVPAGSPAGRYTVQGRAYSADRPPEETSALSGPAAFEVAAPAPTRKKPWWLLAVAGAVVVVLATAAFLVLRDGEDSDTASAPELVGLTQADAERALADAGLETGEVTHRHDPTATPSTVLEATIDGEAVVEEETVPLGTTVDLVVAVTLTAPVLLSPPTGVHVPRGLQFDFSWEAVTDAEAYRFDVQTFQCQIPPDLSRPERTIEEGGFTVEPRLSERLVDLSLRFICSFTTSFSQEVAEPELSSAAVDGLVGGFFQWVVTPLDDFGTPGPSSTPFSLQILT